MVPQIMEAIQSYGNVGLYLVMLLEGLAIPFPGLIIIFALGNILTLEPVEIFWLAVSMSFLYSIVSFIPYIIGLKFQSYLEGKLSKRLRKVQLWFQKYGEWSICFSRFFTVGNYISYIAGVSKVKPWRYWLLTFLGILPWTLSVLFLANLSGKGKKITTIFEGHIFFYFIGVGAALILLCLMFRKAKRTLTGN